MRSDDFDGTTLRLRERGDRRWAIRGAVASGIALTAAAPEIDPSAAKQRCKHKSKDEVKRIIKKAAKRYNQSSKAMLRVATCESNLDPCAVNKRGKSYGLFQFIKSTWKSTPYGHKNIFDAKANAMAAGWMWKQGRKNEWVCQ
ncbi:MAG TPA: transglycosylase SLT domain-containing protein [Thermomicrobiales bacterium]|nr:transglycosylase SLT domain-containing protein [Thermomicrobiales bacterium]